MTKPEHSPSPRPQSPSEDDNTSVKELLETLGADLSSFASTTHYDELAPPTIQSSWVNKVKALSESLAENFFVVSGKEKLRKRVAEGILGGDAKLRTPICSMLFSLATPPTPSPILTFVANFIPHLLWVYFTDPGSELQQNAIEACMIGVYRNEVDREQNEKRDALSGKSHGNQYVAIKDLRIGSIYHQRIPSPEPLSSNSHSDLTSEIFQRERVITAVTPSNRHIIVEKILKVYEDRICLMDMHSLIVYCLLCDRILSTGREGPIPFNSSSRYPATALSRLPLPAYIRDFYLRTAPSASSPATSESNPGTPTPTPSSLSPSSSVPRPILTTETLRTLLSSLYYCLYYSPSARDWELWQLLQDPSATGDGLQIQSLGTVAENGNQEATHEGTPAGASSLARSEAPESAAQSLHDSGVGNESQTALFTGEVNHAVNELGKRAMMKLYDRAEYDMVWEVAMAARVACMDVQQ